VEEEIAVPISDWRYQPMFLAQLSQEALEVVFFEGVAVFAHGHHPPVQGSKTPIVFFFKPDHRERDPCSCRKSLANCLSFD